MNQYINRDISWLHFNQRVLLEASCDQVPIMERFRFLAIFSSNLDEFFKVRYPLISAYASLKAKQREQMTPTIDSDLPGQVQTLIDEQLSQFGNVLNNQLIPQLEHHNITVYYNRDIPEFLHDHLKEYFFSQVLSFIQPVFIRRDWAREFFPQNNWQYFVVSLALPGNERRQQAIVSLPVPAVPRFHCLNDDAGHQHIFFVDDIIKLHLNYIFAGYEVRGCYSIKITRDADLNLDEENLNGSMAAAIEEKISVRDKGVPSRLLFEKDMPFALQKTLASAFGLADHQVFEGGRYHNLGDLADLPISHASLQFPAQPPLLHSRLRNLQNMFAEIEKGDMLLHFPYQAYSPVLAFFNQAAIDPQVVSIYATLYRIAPNSLIANALVGAAKNGKHVTVFVELKARFDEANNLKWSKQMKKAGVKIVYSIPGLKVHSKVALVTKREHGKIKGYAFIGTGNFHEQTARFYADHALFTNRREVIRDLRLLFQTLCHSNISKFRPKDKFKHLLVSQANMVDQLHALINEQARAAKNGGEGSICIKVNNLEDVGIMDALYAAARAGASVRLIVRSVCCMVPNETDLPKLVIKRLIDRYLEHSRMFIFGKGSTAKVYIGSADMMSRNLYNRVEVIAPVTEQVLAAELIDYFEIQWNDTEKIIPIGPPINPCKKDPVAGAIAYGPQHRIYQHLKSLAND